MQTQTRTVKFTTEFPDDWADWPDAVRKEVTARVEVAMGLPGWFMLPDAPVPDSCPAELLVSVEAESFNTRLAYESGLWGGFVWPGDEYKGHSTYDDSQQDWVFSEPKRVITVWVRGDDGDSSYIVRNPMTGELEHTS